MRKKSRITPVGSSADLNSDDLIDSSGIEGGSESGILSKISIDQRYDIYLLTLFSLLIRVVLSPFLDISYDEISYAHTVQTIVKTGNLNLYGNGDLFFFPPLFNYLGAILNGLGLDRLAAVRTVTILLSTFIPPLLFLLVKKSGHGRAVSISAALLWILLPMGIYYSVIGQVETPMLAFVLAAVYMLKEGLEKERISRIVLSAIMLSAAIWIKETAVGFIPVFLFMLIPKKRELFSWILTVFLLCLPLALQTLLPGSYDLFYEVTTPAILWNNISPDEFLGGLRMVTGFHFSLPDGFEDTANIFIPVTLFLAFITTEKREIRKSFILKFSLLSLIVFVPFFTVFPKKFAYYMLLVQLFVIPFLTLFLFRYKRFGLLYVLLIPILCLNGVSPFLSGAVERRTEMGLVKAAKMKPGAKVGMALPRVAEFIIEKKGIDVRIVPVSEKMMDRNSNCFLNPSKCILDNDFYLGNDVFLLSQFCKSWPLEDRNCDKESYDLMKDQFELINRWNGMRLYRINRGR